MLFGGFAGFLKTCGLLVFGLVLIKICLFFADFSFAHCFLFKFYVTFVLQFIAKRNLGVFLCKFAHFDLVFSDFPLWFCIYLACCFIFF